MSRPHRRLTLFARTSGGVVIALLSGCGGPPPPGVTAPPVVTLSPRPPAASATARPEAPPPAASWSEDALPLTAGAFGAYLDEVCTRFRAGDRGWLDRFTRRPLVGHEPMVNEAGTYTWAKASALVPVDPSWGDGDQVPELCARPRTVTGVDGDTTRSRVDAEIEIDGHPFLAVVRQTDGRPMLERLSMRVAPEPERIVSPAPRHEVKILAVSSPEADDPTFAEEAARAVRRTRCWSSFIAREEARDEPELASAMVQIAVDDRGVSFVADGIVPRAVLQCLEAEFPRENRSAFTTAPDAPQVTPWARLSLLVVLKASEIPDDAPMVIGPAN
ncbi:MAG: hypothetical protein AAF928_20050 [Myxococcota bacterium]